MKLNVGIRRKCIVILLLSYSTIAPIHQPGMNENLSFGRFTGSQLANVALCTGIGITLGILWDMQREEQPAQPISTVRKIAQRAASGIFGGLLGTVVGISQYQNQNNRNESTPVANQHNRPAQPTNRPTEPREQQRNQAALNPAQQLALRHAEMRTEFRAGRRNNDNCPICMDKLAQKASVWAFKCEHLTCNDCINQLRITSRQEVNFGEGYPVNFVCSVCRADPAGQLTRL